MDLDNLFKGMNERIQNLYLNMPIYQLGRATNPKYQDLNLMEIGFSVLVFILEKMLTDRGNVTYEQLNHFLSQVLNGIYGRAISYEEADELRKYLVDEKLRNNGNDFIYEYMDFEKKETQIINFKLIEYDKWTLADHLNNEVRLVLTDKGIELLFKTKEYFSEMQLSITMLYFKQQLEKGAYAQVLNVAKELVMQIDTQIRYIDNDEERIKRNALSSFNQKEMESRLERSFEQTKNERNEIIDLRKNTERVKLNYVNGALSKKERKNYEIVLEIDRLLDRSVSKHSILYKRKLELLSTLSYSVQMMIENAFSKRFNFEQEIIENWFEKSVTQEKISQILKPIMPIKRPRVYNPLLAFQPQSIRKKNHEIEVEIDELDEEQLKIQKQKNEVKELEEYEKDKKIMKRILEPLLEKNRYFISDVLKQLRKENFHAYQIFEEQHIERFLEISIALHQSPYKKFELIHSDDLIWDAKETRLLCDLTRENEDLLEVQQFNIFESEKIYTFLDGTEMTDYIVERKM